MTGWSSYKGREAIIEATRIPDHLACPGSGLERIGGSCCMCGMRIGTHRPDGNAQRHKAPAWLRERMET